MPILAIDPGTESSGIVGYDHGKVSLVFEGGGENRQLLDELRSCRYLRQVEILPMLLIESVESYGQRVGFSVFETVRWAGRFQEAWESRGGRVVLVPRREVKMHLCGTMKAKDADIRQALLYRFGDGSRERAMGTKKFPGPLYGVTSHLMAALAVAVTWADKNQKGAEEHGYAQDQEVDPKGDQHARQQVGPWRRGC